MICSINGWELTQQDGNVIVKSDDGIKAGEFSSEAEAKDFCLTNDPLSYEIDWYAVCESVPVSIKRHKWCHNCSEIVKLGKGVEFCKHDRDK